jgi:hypothetical protein
MINASVRNPVLINIPSMENPWALSNGTNEEYQSYLKASRGDS